MKMKSIIQETEQTNEAMPMGAFSKMTSKLGTKLGGIAPGVAAASHGKLAAGQYANNLMLRWRGATAQSGVTPTKDNLLKFLKKNGLPTRKATEVIDSFAKKSQEPTDFSSMPPVSAGGTSVPGVSPVPESKTPESTMKELRDIISEIEMGGAEPKLSSGQVSKVLQAAVQEFYAIRSGFSEPEDMETPAATPPEPTSATASPAKTRVKPTPAASVTSPTVPSLMNFISKLDTNDLSALEAEIAKLKGSKTKPTRTKVPVPESKKR